VDGASIAGNLPPLAGAIYPPQSSCEGCGDALYGEHKATVRALPVNKIPVPEGVRVACPLGLQPYRLYQREICRGDTVVRPVRQWYFIYQQIPKGK